MCCALPCNAGFRGAQARPPTYTLTHSHTLTHPHSLTHTHIHTLTHTHPHTRTHSHLLILTGPEVGARGSGGTVDAVLCIVERRAFASGTSSRSGGNCSVVTQGLCMIYARLHCHTSCHRKGPAGTCLALCETHIQWPAWESCRPNQPVSMAATAGKYSLQTNSLAMLRIKVSGIPNCVHSPFQPVNNALQDIVESNPGIVSPNYCCYRLLLLLLLLQLPILERETQMRE